MLCNPEIADTPLKTNKQQLMDLFVNTSYHKLYFKGNVSSA